MRAKTMTTRTGIAVFLTFDQEAELRAGLDFLSQMRGEELPDSVNDLLDAIAAADPRVEDPDAALSRRPSTAASRVVTEGLCAQLAGTQSALERALILEDVVRTVYEYVKFESPEGLGLDGNDGPERSSIGVVLAEATDHAELVGAPAGNDRF